MARPNATRIDLPSYVDKPPSELQTHLKDWILDKTGYDPSTDAKTKQAAFEMGVKLATTLRMAHQASDENARRRESLSDRRIARAENEEAKADVPPKRRGRPPKAKPVAETEASAEEEEPPVPVVKRGRGRPRKVAPVEPVEESDEEEEPEDDKDDEEVAPKRRVASKSPVRRGRPRKVAPVVEEPEDDEDDEDNAEEEPPRRVATRRKRRPASTAEMPF